MKVLAVICEYNPFHSGHLEQLRLLREKFGEDAAVIGMMSQDFVQRGTPAVISAYDRAEAAVKGGLNLILGINPYFSVSSAEIFAEAAVKGLLSTGLDFTLCFGSESGDLSLLSSAADILLDEPPSYKKFLKENLKKGLSYPAAASMAANSFISSSEFDSFFSENEAGRVREKIDENFWRGSNNILGISYLFTLKKIRRDGGATNLPEIFTHKRTGSSHVSDKFFEGKAVSASAIRKEFFSEAFSDYERAKRLSSKLPRDMCRILLKSYYENNFADQNLFTSAVLTKALSSDIDSLSKFQGMSEGLARRLKEAASGNYLRFQKLESGVDISPAHPIIYADLVSMLSSRRHPKSRVSRALCSLFLGIKEGESLNLLSEGGPFFIKALAADKKGRYLLKIMRNTAKCPVMTKFSDFMEMGSCSSEAYLSRCMELSAERQFDLINRGYSLRGFRLRNELRIRNFKQ